LLARKAAALLRRRPRGRSFDAMERAVPLGPEDRAILDLEGPTIAGHTCKVVVVEAGEADVDALRAEIKSRLGGVPQLTWRLGGSDHDPCWIVDSDFGLGRHVTRSAVRSPLDRAGLRVEVARLFEQRLDRGRPLWHMDVVPMDPGFAIVWGSTTRSRTARRP
jgi:diacylglycerol O-acyltransferase / wax synthase